MSAFQSWGSEQAAGGVKELNQKLIQINSGLIKRNRTNVAPPGGGGSAMDQSEDREEGAPPSKTLPLCGDHESQTRAQSKKRQRGPDSPGTGPVNVKHKRPDSPGPGPSSVSLECDRSIKIRQDFKSSELGFDERVDHGGQQRLKPGLKKYFCELTLDSNTAHRELRLSDNNRKVTRVEVDQSYPDHPVRFECWPQLLCRDGLTGRCYWEVEWKGKVDISVSYRGIRRKGNSSDCLFGWNDQSWNLFCSDGFYSVWHGHRRTDLPLSPSSDSDRVAVYVDCPAGTLSFYRVSSDSLIHLHTFSSTFTEPLYPGFGLSPGSSVSVC
ncbi:stonustoxin subunit beta-like [Halichoeres trimaculatus]|uniref:stonustoxin subunit beta-like n=1 Tax=Halichoeres trimaculatus TaxID=147232 RepID=UPI003D9DF5A2